MKNENLVGNLKKIDDGEMDVGSTWNLENQLLQPWSNPILLFAHISFFQ